MTYWGVLLFVIYLALGLSRTPRGKAMTLGVALTALVIGVAMFKIAK